MRIQIMLKFHDKLMLPIQYNNIFQAIILKWLGDENYQKFIHDTGYEYNKRRYKMYSFSRLEGAFRMNRENKTITYFDQGKFIVSSSDDKFLNYIVNKVILEDEIFIHNQRVSVEEVRCFNKKLKSGDKIYTKSPIVAYSTFEHDGSKKTYYYSPMEKDFETILRRNLINKFNAAYEKEPGSDEFSIKPINNPKLRESTVVYKGTIIKGWSGEFIVEGSEELLNMAYNAGIGSKNGQGFGCVEIGS